MRERAKRSLRAGILTLAAFGLLASPAHAADAGSQIFDAIVLRPLGAIGVCAGFFLFVPAALLTSPGGMDSINEAWTLFVGDPADAAFVRPLGEF